MVHIFKFFDVTERENTNSMYSETQLFVMPIIFKHILQLAKLNLNILLSSTHLHEMNIKKKIKIVLCFDTLTTNCSETTNRRFCKRVFIRKNISDLPV